MNWLRRSPSAEATSVKEALKEAEVQRGKKRQALRALVKALEEMPLDTTLAEIGSDIVRKVKEGH